MKYGILLLSIFLVACSSTVDDPNNAAFVTLLGNDTLAVEQFSKTETGIKADVILRAPNTTFTSYDMTYDGSWGIQEMSAFRYDPQVGFDGESQMVMRIVKEEDSLQVMMQTRNGAINRTVGYERGVLPFIDMVHWPYEIGINNALRVGIDSVNQKMLSGTRVSNFIFAKIADDSMTIRHPSRGVMGTNFDENGNMAMLDAGLTTRKLIVKRVPTVDLDEIGARFAKLDAAGKSFGSLSGQVEETFEFKDAVFKVSYGSPAKRGRVIFGGIVPYGQRWRTGANRATHFSTSEDIEMGGLMVPAGEYTLFTIPESNGATLIINTQTGQNGRTYDEKLDLGRVQMYRQSQNTITESFSIKVEETVEGGVLKLIWDQTIYAVDFELD